jgi:hypothetical protein
LDTLFSALATLQALESIALNAPEVRQAEDESTLVHPGSLMELLRVPTLRYVCFDRFNFTSALFQATANALMEGTAITRFEFDMCSFSTGECAATMATGLSRNTLVISIRVEKCNNGRVLYTALAAALPSNSTLQHLEMARQDTDGGHDCLPPIFSALEENIGLKTLKVAMCESMDESLYTAMKNGLGMNATLESLELNNLPHSTRVPICGTGRFPFSAPTRLSTHCWST